MLQNNKMRPEISREMAAPDLLSPVEALETFRDFVRRQFPVIVFVTLLTLVLGVIYLVTAQPRFTAKAQLLIDARKLQVFQQQSVLGDIPIDTAQVESQVEVLKSENVASTVIKELHLTEDPEFVGSGGGLLGALFSTVFSIFNNTGPDQTTASEFELSRRAMNTFQNRLSVTRVALTYVIEIDFQSYNAERAAQIANAVADAYVLDQLQAKYQATRRASVWLQDRIKELRDQASVAERAVVEFRTKNNIVATGGTGTDRRLIGEQQVAELTSQLSIARANTAEARARLDRIEFVLKSDAPHDSMGETVADTLKNEVVTKLRSKYLDLAATYSLWVEKYGPNHLAVVNLRNQMREIRKSIFEELKRLGETYKSDLAIAKQREVGLRKELAQAVTQSQATDEKSITLRELQSTAETYKALYDNFLQRYMEAVQQQSFPITEARVISSASRPLEPSHPRRNLVLAIAGVGGLILSFGIGFLRDLSERVFRTTDQIENSLQVPCIGFVPLVASGNAKSGTTNPMHKSGTSEANPRAQSEHEVTSKNYLVRLREMIGSFVLVRDRRAISEAGTNLPTSLSRLTKAQPPEAGREMVPDNSVLWAMHKVPLSRFAEEIRSVKLAIDLNGTTKTSHVIGITSSLPNEGKSTISAALAQLTSQIGARAILVDCDLRNPSLTRMLAPDASVGMLEVLAGSASLDDSLWTEPTQKMAFLPMVIKSRLAHSTEILRSDQTRKLLEQLRNSYDYVVLDFPPLAPVVDVRATSHLVDAFIFVVEWGRTKIDVVEHALTAAPLVYENLLGVVLNKVNMSVFGRYSSHRENYYYNKHYDRYGYTE